MKLLMMDCNAEELHENRTLLQTITDVLNNFSEALIGRASITEEAVAAAMARESEATELEVDEDEDD